MTHVLEGLKVLDFTTLLVGPFATLHLADMGAEVLRIVSPSRSDFLLTAPPFIPGTEISAADAQLNRNKRCMFLNLKDDRAVEIIHRLVGAYDIVIESFRPGVMAKLKVDYDRLKQINPKLIYCSVTAFGQTGPLRFKPGHDINFMARSGIASYSGKKATGPCLGGLQTDLASGACHAIIGILAAVICRNRTGRGQHIDISMTDALVSFSALYGAATLVDGRAPELEGEYSNGGNLYDYYETKDGRHISFAPIESKFFTTFCNRIDRPDLIPGGISPDNMEKVKQEIAEIFLTKTRDEWVDLFKEDEVCVEPVMDLSEALHSPLAREREMVVDLPLANGKRVRQLANPIKFSQATPTYKHSDFLIRTGVQSREICKELGYSEKEIADFEKGGLFYDKN